jgi:glycosyltransferase involved in cell wall biosynthesis
LANEIGVESDSAFVGFVGRLSGEKGLHILIDAFAIIEDQLPRHHLVIVGEGGLFAALQEQIRERKNENRVHLLGYRDDPWPYFRAFDCHVLASSEFEGVPQAMLQAMFAGCPVIGTQAGGIPDIVIDRETGLLVPPDNPQRLSEAILKIIQEPEDAEKRAARARQYVWENHTIDAMGEKILRVYRMQLSEKTENP